MNVTAFVLPFLGAVAGSAMFHVGRLLLLRWTIRRIGRQLGRQAAAAAVAGAGAVPQAEEVTPMERPKVEPVGNINDLLKGGSCPPK